MDRLILLRHGRAERFAASGRDFDRSLEPRGEREVAAVAGRMADAGFSPDLVLLSPSARTRGTWAAAQALFPNALMDVCDELYSADAEGVLRLAASAGERARTVMVIGHNPGLQDLTAQLLREGAAPASLVSRAESQFPPAAAAAFLIDAHGRPAYDGLFLPQTQDAD
jgi:phosphohistidine phosphatase